MKLKFLRRSKLDKLINWSTRHFILLLVVAAMIAMAISLSVGMAQSVWFDEAYSIIVAQQPLPRMIYLISVDTHPPFYYFLLSFWGSLFGWGEFALRGLSVLMMGGAVIFAGLLSKKVFSVRTALITLPFIAFAPFLLRYGFEIRMYALASLIGVAATYVLVLALEAKRKKMWLFGLYGLLVALGVYTLYYMVLLWLAQFVWLIWQRRSKKESVLKTDWFKAYLFSVVLFLPWIPAFITQITGGALAQISQSMTIDNLVGIVSFSFLFSPVWRLGPVASLVIVFVVLMLGYSSVRAFQLVDKRQKKYLVLFALYIMVPVAVLTLVGLAKPMYVERYLSHVLIGASIFVGAAVAIVTKRSTMLAWVLSALLLVVMLFGIAQLYQTGNYNFQRLQKPDIHRATNTVSDCNDSAIVFASDPYEAIEISYYLPKCKIYFYSDPTKLIGGYTMLSDSNLLVNNPSQQFKDARTIYYFYYAKNPNLMMPSGVVSRSNQDFGSLTVEKLVAR